MDEQLIVIQNKIYEIRGQRVMLDFDLAEIYGVETRKLKQAVRRNIERFEGDDFMFELTEREYNYLNNSLRSQIVISNRGGIRYTPFAFTEMGVAMLSSVLKSSIAIEINRNIMRAFVAVRQMIAAPERDELSQLQQEVRDLKEYIEEVFSDYNDINEDTRVQLELINRTLAELQTDKRLLAKSRNPIGFIKPDDK